MRRTHDIGKGGWWVALFMLPLVNFYVWFKSGDTGDNEFGAPRSTTSLETIIAYLLIAFVAFGVVGAVIAAIVYSGYAI